MGMLVWLEKQGLRGEGINVGKERFWEALRLSTNQESIWSWPRVTCFAGYLPVASVSIGACGLCSVLLGLGVHTLHPAAAGRSCQGEALVEDQREKGMSASGSSSVSIASGCWKLLALAMC